MIKISESISYRQLCILSIFGGMEISREHFRNADCFELRKESYRGKHLGYRQAMLLHEIYNLYDQGLLNFSGKALLGFSTDIIPSEMKIQGAGELLYLLMELWRIDEKDSESIIKLLNEE
jgi:hypothetical protein